MTIVLGGLIIGTVFFISIAIALRGTRGYARPEVDWTLYGVVFFCGLGSFWEVFAYASGFKIRIDMIVLLPVYVGLLVFGFLAVIYDVFNPVEQGESSIKKKGEKNDLFRRHRFGRHLKAICISVIWPIIATVISEGILSIHFILDGQSGSGFGLTFWIPLISVVSLSCTFLILLPAIFLSDNLTKNHQELSIPNFVLSIVLTVAFTFLFSIFSSGNMNVSLALWASVVMLVPLSIYQAALKLWPVCLSFLGGSGKHKRPKN